MSDEYFNQYNEPNATFENTHVHDDDEEVEEHGARGDREYMTQLRDQIAQQLMHNME